MSTLHVPLDRLQRWMLGLVVHPGPVEEALRVAEAEVPAGRIGDVVLPSKTLTAAERVGIYHGMYPLRMTEALQSDYPALAHYLGDDSFRDLVHGYVQAFPSRTYTLNRLGDHLPEYVKTAPGVRRPAFCHDLARLELAVSEVFDAPETPPLSEKAIAAVSPEAWEHAMLAQAVQGVGPRGESLHIALHELAKALVAQVVGEGRVVGLQRFRHPERVHAVVDPDPLG
ncbi:MAG TPA: DNA-binding domain-containing protein, partial [Vicinamibacteria bacterium]